MKTAYGWSLLELLIVLAIFTLLSAAAIPSFKHTIKRSESEQAANTLLKALQLSQSQASFRKQIITFCPVRDMKCTKNKAQHIAVYIDENQNRAIDPGEESIRFYKLASSKDSFIKLKASFGRKYIRFKHNGHAMEGGSVLFCDRREDLYGQVITINYTGRAYLVQDDEQRREKLDC